VQFSRPVAVDQTAGRDYCAGALNEQVEFDDND
jgi:hypothetical protein